jgi:transposase
MGKPLPMELRQRVVDFVEEGSTHRAAATQFQVSIKFVNDMALLKRRTGSLIPKPQDLDADGFAAAVRKALPGSRKLSAAGIQRLKEEHRQNVEPARIAAVEAQALERRLSDLVNSAYGMAPAGVRLMWTTAPHACPSPGTRAIRRT